MNRKPRRKRTWREKRKLVGVPITEWSIGTPGASTFEIISPLAKR